MPYVNKIAPQKLSNYIFFLIYSQKPVTQKIFEKCLYHQVKKMFQRQKKSYFNAELNKKTIFEMIQKID